MDYSKLSTETLKMLQSGEVDYSKIPTEDLKLIRSTESTEPREIGALEAAARGAGQGVFGLGDELEGATRAAFDVAGDDYSIKNLLDRYRSQRDEARKQNVAAQAANPKTFLGGELGSGLATALIPGLNVAKGASLGAKVGMAGLQGAAYGLGSSTADLTEGELGQAAKDAAMSGATSAGISGALSGVPSAFKYLSGKAAGRAEKLAESATGATRAQAEKFVPGSGRELLNRGLVKFGDAPGDIADRAKSTMKQSGEEIGSILSKLDESGVSIPSEDVVGAVDEMAQAIKSKGAGYADQVKILDKIKEDIASSIGEGPIGLSQLEQQKRSFGNVNWMDPEKAMAKKQTYRALMDLVEKAASEADPQSSDKFLKAKETYKLLAPIQEAAEKRSLQLNQSPWGGLLDVAAAGTAGATVGGIPGAVAGAVGRRVVSPRLKSSAAVGFDKLSQALAGSVSGAETLSRKAPFLQQGAEDYVSPKQAADAYQNRR